MAAISQIMDAFSPKSDAGDAGGGGITVTDIFSQMKDKFQAGAAAGVDVVFQYEISGPGGGTWHQVIKDGTLEVNEGAHGSPTTTMKIGDEDFIKMMTGELNAMTAFTGGKLKITGDVMKSQLLEKLFKF